MNSPKITIPNSASGDIALLAFGHPRSTVALGAIKDALMKETLSPEDSLELRKIAKQFEAQAAGSRMSSAELIAQGIIDLSASKKEYSRPGFGPHPAIDFSVTVNSPITARMLLVKLLGNAAASAVLSWKNFIDFDQLAPTNNKFVLFTKSNCKIRKYAPQSDKSSTQYDDFNGAGLRFADDLQATIVCATFTNIAKEAGLDLSEDPLSWESKQQDALAKLDPLVVHLMTMLNLGCVGTFSGALNIRDSNLSACEAQYNSHGHNWAAGCAAPAE